MADISKIKLPDGNTYDVKDTSKSSATNWVNGSANGSVRMVNSTAESSSYTIGIDAVAEGTSTKASGTYSHAEGGGTTASNSGAHAEGSGTTASGAFSHVEGGGTKATAAGAHAEGQATTASGDNAHSEGYLTEASGADTHSEGYHTIASGYASHTEGYETAASGASSHAEGYYTVANHLAQHVFGQYNIADASTAIADNRGNYIEIVGNGTSSARSNARTLDWSGNEWLAGKLTVGAVGVNSMDVATVGQLSDYVVTLTESWAYEATEATYSFDKTFAEIKSAIDAKKDVVLYKVSNWEDEEGVIHNDDAKSKYAFSNYFPSESEQSSAWISFTAVSYAYDTWISADQITLYEDESVEITSGDSSINVATDEGIGAVKPWYYHQATATGITVGHDSRVITVNARTTTTGRYYGVETDINGLMFVNVPWTDSTPVTSVNGQTGTITLSASDVGAQPTLVSGTNIKTVNGNSLLGSGDITISSGLQNLVDGIISGSLVGINAGSAVDNPGTNSIALGYKSYAPGINSMAAGYWSAASGNCSFALGESLIAQRKHQTAIGKFNIADTGGTDATTDGNYAVIVGNGTSSARSNALTVDWSGNVNIPTGASYQVNGVPIGGSQVQIIRW